MAPPPLPEELLVRICSYLCFHCQNPDDFPNPDEPCVRESKATLARFCRVSKRMLAVGQPILYHYYATGNILGPIQPMISDYPTADDKLPAFLCTLIRHPFLATHIRSLQLQEMQSTHLPAFAPELLPLLNSASRTHGVRPPTSLQWVIDPTLPRPKDANEKKTRVTIHLWLRELAIILTPHTEKLMYGHKPFSPPTHIEASDRVLPALTSLTCRSGGKMFSPSMTQLLLRRAPNLVSLHVIDILGTYGDGVADNVPPALPQVRRLVAEGLRMDTFQMMIRWCEGVRDVEYYYHTTFYGVEMLGALAPIRGVLRRFCYMFTSGRLASYNVIGAPYERLLPKNRYQTIESLQRFCQLEELVIDQWAFYSDEYGYGDTKRLITLLPASIQSVHFRYVYKSMQAELLQLALAVPDSFPKLRRLRVDIAENCRPERRQGLEQMRSVGADFADVGVQVEWGVDRSYSRASIVIPEGIVSPVSAPVISPPTDSSSPIEAEIPNTRRGWRGVTPRFRKGISSFRSNYLPG
ncbi:hypothetical protein V500_08380 [Pseudogymnoascus sp. VKM F-4518 (FW-2643)]|nr:hypothetical protein V500_08380 [Pseudogymnoascus sp. VKM F-4518 (FW-2643)]